MYLRYQKLDQFKNPVFVVGNNNDEKDSYERLKKFHTALEKQNLNTFLPIYSTDSYSTIRFKSNPKFSFADNHTYEVEYVIRKREMNGKNHVSCYMNKSRLVKKGAALDYGEILNLE